MTDQVYDMHLLKKFGWRLIGALGIYVFFKITSTHSGEEIFGWTLKDEAYLYFYVFVVLIICEISDRIVKYFDRSVLCKNFSKKKLIYIFWIDTVALIPLLLAVNYFSVFIMKVWLGFPAEDPISNFWGHIIQSLVIAWLVIAFQLGQLNFKYAKKAESQTAAMQKELLLSKYETLKNQVNPHFLFNSFSVLSSLIHENQELASEFLDQLSKMYRYMLDNRDNRMVSLSKEVEFMKSYIFLQEARHEEGIDIKIDLSLDQDVYFIPTLSLQMLIENAIKHNKFSKDNPMTIRIFNESDEYLVVENELRAKTKEIQSTKVGLENIRNRYNYQSDKRVIIAENDSHFTVKLPILTSMQFS